MDLSANKKVSKMKIEFPIAYFEHNLIFNHNKEVWAIYEIDSFIYDHLSDQQKIERLISLTSFIGMITSKYHILWLPKTHDIKKHHNNLKSRLSGPMKKWGKQVITHMSEYLENNYNDYSGSNNADYRAYVAVHIPKSESKDLVDQVASTAVEIKNLIMQPKRLIETIAGLNEPEIFEHEFQNYLIKEKQIFDRLSRRMKIKEATPSTIEWIIKRNFWWGIADPALRSTDTQEWSPRKSEGKKRGGLKTFFYDSRQVLTLTEGDIDCSHPRRVSITQPHDGEEKKIHHAYLTLSDLPDSMDMPGSEWLYSASTLPFPVEMSIKVEVLEAREAINKLSKKKMDIDNQVKNIEEARATIPIELQDKQENALYLENELKKRKNPTLLTHVTFGTCSTDINVLKSNVKILQDHYRDFGNIQVDIPAGDQWLLFNDFIPGSPLYVTDYIQRIPPETLAAGMFGATQELGDREGLYIGTTGALSHPVYFNPGLASQINRSPSITVTGTLGGGKSVTANLIGYLNAAVLGGKTLIFDPKGERTHWPDALPELDGQIQVATLSSSFEDQGKLDPFVMIEDIEIAKEAAVEILAYLSSTKTNSVEYSYISRSVQKVAQNPKPYLAQCIDELYEMGKSEDRRAAHTLAEILESFQTLSFAKLLFGTGAENTIQMDFAINILQIQNLKMPSPDKLPENYSLDEKMSVALMFAIARFAHKFIYHDRSIFKYVLMDEAWALLGTQAGKALADMVVRTGRSLNGGAVFITQNATDVAGDLAGNIGVKFAFRDSDTTKIKNTLSYFGLEHTQDNIDMIKNLDNGQCLMQDIYGRVGLVRIDVVFQHLFDCFDTRPPEANHDDDEELDVLTEFQRVYDEVAAGGGLGEDENPDDESED